MDMTLNLLLMLFICLLKDSSARSYDSDTEGSILRWCTTSPAEQRKCMAWRDAVEQKNEEARNYRRIAVFNLSLQCVQTTDKDQCLNSIANGKADATLLEAGEIFLAGRYYSLVPIVSEVYGPAMEAMYYSVAVVRKNDDSIRTPLDLKNKNVCFPGVGQMGGWVLPLLRLLEDDFLPVEDCNNMVKSSAKFFNNSCAPNSLIDQHNPTGDNPLSMCALCQSSCSGNEPYRDFGGAFKCLYDRGQAAFLKQNTVDFMVDLLTRRPGRGRAPTRREFDLLCPKGGRAPLESYRDCNWGAVPAHAVVVLSSVLPKDRLRIQQFLQTSADVFGTRQSSGPYSSNRGINTVSYPSFTLFGSSEYRNEDDINIIFSQDATSLRPIPPNKQTYFGYLGKYGDNFEKLRKCPVPTARFCVVSEKEQVKCKRMSTAFKSQMLKPELSCVTEHTKSNCMRAIQNGVADLTILDAADVVRGGQHYGLIPIVAEHYDLDEPSYYAVAIAKQSDKETDLLFLKNKKSCHTAFGDAAGWVMPISFLLSNKRMRSYGRNSAKAASEFFQKSCAPGALSTDSVKTSWKYKNLCALCHGQTFRFCSDSALEPFFGNTGALRCLIEGGGDIAFARHTTIKENTNLRNPSFWARNVIPDDLELICKDGTRAKFDQFEICNLGKVASDALVTSKHKPREHIESYVNLFLLAQQLYGSSDSEESTFKMFKSEVDYPDLIFHDATTHISAVPEERQDYKVYVGTDFVKSLKVVDSFSSSFALKPASLLIVILFTIYLAF